MRGVPHDTCPYASPYYWGAFTVVGAAWTRRVRIRSCRRSCAATAGGSETSL